MIVIGSQPRLRTLKGGGGVPEMFSIVHQEVVEKRDIF